VLGSRAELEGRAVAGLDALAGHSPHRPYIDEVRIACAKCGGEVQRVPDVGNPWLDAGIVSLSTMRYRSDPEYWKRWFPADLITESFPGQFRNWFYSLLAMSTVMVGSEPTKTVFGYGLVFAEDGRQMHKSWGNSIEFDEAADRMGADVKCTFSSPARAPKRTCTSAGTARMRHAASFSCSGTSTPSTSATRTALAGALVARQAQLPRGAPWIAGS